MGAKEEAEKSAKENWELARRWRERGNYRESDEAIRRAIENEKEADSWLYRTFGW